MLDQARQIAALDETPPVLITGETGTGKGLVARTIHGASPRAARPFIEVNCTALPATLMEAELFGHERGAFTDAKESRMGLFEAADGGFLFLDEVGDVELSLQGKLLKAVEDRTVRRVGGIRDRRIDVRILAATNRDLERDAQREQFRRDLYFRLAVIILHLPPLRERGAATSCCWRSTTSSRFNAKYGKQVRQIDPRAPRPAAGLSLARQRARAEPRHRAGRALESGPTLDAEHLSLATPGRAPDTGERPRAGRRLPESPPAPERSGSSALPPPGMDLERWERAMIEQALRECDGNQTRAAQRLGISRDTLRYRLKKFGPVLSPIWVR